MKTPEENECVRFNSYLILLKRSNQFTYTFSGNGGKRHISVATKLKRMGLRAGVWDYYFRAHGVPSLWIEMKHGRNGLTREQMDWHDELVQMGDTFNVCYSAEEALRALIERKIISSDSCGMVGRMVYVKTVSPTSQEKHHVTAKKVHQRLL